MHVIDWLVLSASLIFIVGYGLWKGRANSDVDSYFLANRSMRWYTVLFSIMATQASAITFLSAPGQAYADGMRFVQFYFGLPIGMVILSITAIPIYNRLKIRTAYEFLESRFDLKTRTLTSLLFQAGRGLAAGLTIYAPALILSVILGWDITYTNILIGALVIIYTAWGGTSAVNWTQTWQMLIIAMGMIAAFIMILVSLPPEVGVIEATHIAGKLGRMNLVDFNFDLNNRYNVWSGILGGMFLQLSYFGTDQSQVQRYLSGRSVTESRLGLLMNGLVKIPMQFFILFIGVMVFAFFQFEKPPVFFNKNHLQALENSEYAGELTALQEKHDRVFEAKKEVINDYLEDYRTGGGQEDLFRDKLKAAQAKQEQVKEEVVELISSNDQSADTRDINYIFLVFVTRYLPAGLVGLVIAAIIAASMSSTAGELNALSSASIVDIYQRIFNQNESAAHYLKISRLTTGLWGVYAVIFAEFAGHLGSMIEAVNLLGSLTYGPILGIFMTGFYLKKVTGNPVFLAALFAEILVLYFYLFTDVAFLWYNPIGCLGVMFFALILQAVPGLSTNSEN